MPAVPVSSVTIVKPFLSRFCFSTAGRTKATCGLSTAALWLMILAGTGP